MGLDLQEAVNAYRHGLPVVVLDRDENLLYGTETLEIIAQTSVSLQCKVIDGIDRIAFEESDWPEILEAARLVFMQNSFPNAR